MEALSCKGSLTVKSLNYTMCKPPVLSVGGYNTGSADLAAPSVTYTVSKAVRVLVHNKGIQQITTFSRFNKSPFIVTFVDCECLFPAILTKATFEF